MLRQLPCFSLLVSEHGLSVLLKRCCLFPAGIDFHLLELAAVFGLFIDLHPGNPLPTKTVPLPIKDGGSQLPFGKLRPPIVLRLLQRPCFLSKLILKLLLPVLAVQSCG